MAGDHIDATPFVLWFLERLTAGIAEAEAEARFLVMRNGYFMRFSNLPKRGEKVLRRLFAEGPRRVSEGISASPYSKIAGVSLATATRDLVELEALGAVIRGAEGGRSTRYLLTLAARYGAEPLELMVYLAGQRGGDAGVQQVDDVAPDMRLLRLWAKACRIDPERLRRRSLASRYPDQPRGWLLTEAVPVCLACFDADVAAGRDAYLRANWRLAEQVVCPSHRTMLLDRCPACRGRLRLSFRMLNGLLRPFCRKCDAVLTGGGGEAEDPLKANFAAGVLDLQRQINGIVRGDSGRLDRLEYAIRTLWAPLDRDGAARPVLALWYDEPGWNCPYEARSAVGRVAPLQHLSARWRALTLVILNDLFGADLVPGAVLPEAALVLFRRAATLPWLTGGRDLRNRKEKRALDAGAERVHRLSKRAVHQLNGNFLDERGDFGRIHP